MFVSFSSLRITREKRILLGYLDGRVFKGEQCDCDWYEADATRDMPKTKRKTGAEKVELSRAARKLNAEPESRVKPENRAEATRLRTFPHRLRL